MKLITYQTLEALTALQKTGILITDVSYLNAQKYIVPYNWFVGEMKHHKILPQNGEVYPIWAWAKCGSSLAPKKKKKLFWGETKQISPNYF